MNSSHTRVFAFALAGLGMLAAAGGCSNKKAAPSIAQLSAERQYRDALADIEDHRLNQAKATLQTVQYADGEERRQIEPLVRLATADATFYAGNELGYIDARNLYLDFVTLYGDHRLAPYAQFQAGMCSLEQVVDPAKDQTQTFQAIEEFKMVERRYPNTEYAVASKIMRHAAEANLAEHSFEVGRFYLKRKNYLAAVDRFRDVLENFPEYKRIDKVYLYMGKTLLRANNESEARIYLDKLISDHPNGQFTPEAKKALEDAGGALETRMHGQP
jgi:outer membrane protein assembly factor BamD